LDIDFSIPRHFTEPSKSPHAGGSTSLPKQTPLPPMVCCYWLESAAGQGIPPMVCSNLTHVLLSHTGSRKNVEIANYGKNILQMKFILHQIKF